jgi:hypothetical protein
MVSGTGEPSLGPKAPEQFLPSSNKTAERLIKWLPGLLAVLEKNVFARNVQNVLMSHSLLL